MIAAGHDIADRIVDCRRPGCRSQSRSAILQRGHPLFKHIRCRIHQTAVDIAPLT